MYDKGATAYRQYDKLKSDEMVSDHLPLVYKLARQVANATVSAAGSLELNDLVSAGVIGLYKAIDRFDPERGHTFGVFAAHHVKGAMLDELRKVSLVPRGMRDRQTKVKAAMSALQQGLLREPTDEEVADKLGIGMDTYHEWLVELGWTSVWSVEALEETGTFDIEDLDARVQPGTAAVKRDTQKQLTHAIQGLTDREQRVLYLYYQEELTLKEIAYVLELSESQVSRIHSKAIIKLRQMMDD